MVATGSFETLISIYQTTQRHIQEDNNLHRHLIPQYYFCGMNYAEVNSNCSYKKYIILAEVKHFEIIK
jgi:hypothetical protein